MLGEKFAGGAAEATGLLNKLVLVSKAKSDKGEEEGREDRRRGLGHCGTGESKTMTSIHSLALPHPFILFFRLLLPRSLSLPRLRPRTSRSPLLLLPRLLPIIAGE